MDGKAFMAFLADLEDHHGRRFNEKSIQLLAPRFMKLPTECLTETAALILKTGYSNLPAPMHVATFLESEAGKIRLKKADDFQNQWDREKAAEAKLLSGLTDGERDDFQARSFQFVLLMASQAPKARKLRAEREMCEKYPDVYPITDFWKEVEAAKAAGIVADCEIAGELIGPEECPLYLAALTG